MELWEAIVLGVIQGLTEFLPVSSSGHLELANHLFGIEEPSNLSFTIAVHAGTVLSTIVVFFRELCKIFKGVFQFRLNEETIFAINIAVSMVPILFVGLFFKDQVEGLYTGNMLLVGAMLFVTAILLTFTHFSKPRHKPVTPRSAFIIGIAQAFAALPGLSRSGATISAALLQGVKREEAAKFSFLMVLIPIIGMNLLDVMKGEFSNGIPAANIIAGFVTAFAVGTLACRAMIRIVNRGKLIWFAVYCVGAGILAMTLHFAG